MIILHHSPTDRMSNINKLGLIASRNRFLLMGLIVVQLKSNKTIRMYQISNKVNILTVQDSKQIFSIKNKDYNHTPIKHQLFFHKIIE